MDLKEKTILGDEELSHWYYVSKGKALLRILKDSEAVDILDVGAGSGVFSKILIDAGICKSAICVDPGYPEERKEVYRGRPITFARSIDRLNQSLILMMDVLEHVDDDAGLLRRYVRRMPAGARVLVTVPAFQCLWSGHDAFLGHKRRYTRRMVEECMREVGLAILDIRFFFSLLLPVVALIRRMDRRSLEAGGKRAESMLKNYPEPLNRLLVLIHDFERATAFRFNKLAGLSIFCLSEKK